MKNFSKARIVPFFGIIALVAVIGFGMVSCGGDDDGGGGGGDPSLSGNITISPTTAVVGTELTATYSGNETDIKYQWKRGSTNVGTNSNKYTPDQAGKHTVTVSATGFKSKTSAAVSVTATSGGGNNASIVGIWYVDEAKTQRLYEFKSDKTVILLTANTDFGTWDGSGNTYTHNAFGMKLADITVSGNTMAYNDPVDGSSTTLYK